MSSEIDQNKHGFSVRIVAAKVWDPMDDNVDVEVEFADGRKYSAAFFTLTNLRSLFEKNKETGECRCGLYLWAADMILVERLTMETIRSTIAGLVEEDELDSALTRVD